MTGKSCKPKRIKPSKVLLSLGDHIRKKRIETELLQKDVAHILKVSTETVTNWENGNFKPQVQHYPAIISFLGYFPFEIESDSFGGKIKEYRFRQGLSHKEMGKLLEVHATTIGDWETNSSIPGQRALKRVNELLSKPS